VALVQTHVVLEIGPSFRLILYWKRLSGAIGRKEAQPLPRVERYNTYQAFAKEFAKLFKQDLRLVEFEPYQSDTTRYYVAVYERGTGGNVLKVAQDQMEFMTKRAEMKKYGLQLVDIELFRFRKVLKATRKPTRKPDDKPAGKPVGKPVGKPAGKPAGKPTGKPIKWPTLNGDRPGNVTKNANDFSDRCVPNVIQQIENGLNRGKSDKVYLAYRSGGHGVPILENNTLGELPNVKLFKRIRRLIRLKDAKHRQGIVRYYDKSSRRNYFYVSSSTFKHPGFKKGAGVVEIVQWGKQPGRSGDLGSNIGNQRDRPPNSDYKVIGRLILPGNHAGGMQIMGRFLVVPFYGNPGNPTAIAIYDLKDPKKPELRTLRKSVNSGTFGNASLTRLANGLYLLLGAGGGKITTFVSKKTTFPEKNNEWIPGPKFSPGKLWAAGGIRIRQCQKGLVPVTKIHNL